MQENVMTQGGGEADTKYNMGASMRVVDRISRATREQCLGSVASALSNGFSWRVLQGLDSPRCMQHEPRASYGSY